MIGFLGLVSRTRFIRSRLAYFGGSLSALPRSKYIKARTGYPRRFHLYLSHSFLTLSFAFPFPNIFRIFVIRSADMQSGPSYSTQSPNMDVASDHLLPPFYRDATYSRQQQEYDSSRMLYFAASRYSPNGEYVLRQSWTTPPSTYSYPMISSVYDLHYLNRSTRSLSLTRPLETFGARDSTPRAPYIVDNAEHPEAFMPPNVHYLPRSPAPVRPDWNVQDVGVDDSVTSYPPHLVEGNGRSPNVPSFKPPPHDPRSFPIYDTVQIGAPTLNAGYGPSALEGHRGYREEQTFYDPNELRVLPSGHAATGRFPTPTCSTILPNIAEKTTTNVGTGSPSMYYSTAQAGHGGNHEWVDGNDHGSGNVAQSFPYSNESWHQQLNSFHRLPHRDIGDFSMHGRSPEADHSHTSPSMNAPSADAPRNLTARDCCGWQDNSGRKCGAPVTYDNLAYHFAALHGIRNLASDAKIICRWCPPGKIVKRESLLRHLREHHLGYQRPKKGVAQPSPQFPSVTHAHRTFNAGRPVESRTFAFSYPPHGPSPTRTRSPRSRDFPTSGFPVDILPQSSWNQNG
ncbi:hypothetical protein F5141DRAFT_623634 [Pisolithus sp. B1]|nr:hypothetical protein F5141DRAFT_623634 [Pisolithus sp. B1]